MNVEIITTLVTATLGLITLSGAVVTLLHERSIDIAKVLRDMVRRVGGSSRKP